MKAKKTTSTKAPSPAGVTLGIDLGGTKILAGIVDASMKVKGRGKVKTPFQGDEKALTDALLTASDMALKEAGKSRADVTAVAVAAPGPIDKS
ncbi:MAG TPA: ROK family protein, partial [Thermoanaerobaculia bacterium]|nr:ROK family protein [Thermoanaerobaculia bacterium]